MKANSFASPAQGNISVSSWRYALSDTMKKLQMEEGVKTTKSQSFKRTSHTCDAKSVKSIGLLKFRASVASARWEKSLQWHSFGTPLKVEPQTWQNVSQYIARISKAFGTMVKFYFKIRERILWRSSYLFLWTPVFLWLFSENRESGKSMLFSVNS